MPGLVGEEGSQLPGVEMLEREPGIGTDKVLKSGGEKITTCSPSVLKFSKAKNGSRHGYRIRGTWHRHIPNNWCISLISIRYHLSMQYTASIYLASWSLNFINRCRDLSKPPISSTNCTRFELLAVP